MNTKKKKKKINIQFEVEYDEVQFQGNWIPKTLYKYRDWKNRKHKTILTKNSIWIPDSFDFNDPFDCNIPINYNEIPSNREMRESYYKKIVIPGSEGKVPNLYNEEVQRQLFEQRFTDSKFLSDFPKAVLNETKRRTGVFTLTPINDNILMWAHYANSHKGFCLGFDSTKLFNSRQFAGDYVDYQAIYPNVSPMEEDDTMFKKMVFTKSNHWEYELEYRLTTVKFTNKLFKIRPEIYTEIIFGRNMHKQDKDVIRKIIEKKFPHIKIYNCVPSPNTYEIAIVEET